MGSEKAYFSTSESYRTKALEKGIKPYSGLVGSTLELEQKLDKMADSAPSAPKDLKLSSCVKLMPEKDNDIRRSNIAVNIRGLDCYAVTYDWYDSMRHAFIKRIDQGKTEEEILEDTTIETRIFWETLRKIGSPEEIKKEDMVLVPGYLPPTTLRVEED